MCVIFWLLYARDTNNKNVSLYYRHYSYEETICKQVLDRGTDLNLTISWHNIHISFSHQSVFLSFINHDIFM